MKNLNYEIIEKKHQKLLEIAKNYMENIPDYEHNIFHMNDVVIYTKELLNNLKIDVDIEVCIISAYWHDVGRIVDQDNHEKISAKMLEKEMYKLKYSKDFIKKCYKAIENHRWDMNPTTNEGLIIKDADKLAWIGKRRWLECLNNFKRLELVEALPNLRNKYLYFEESKKIYDRDIVKLTKLIYDKYCEIH